jgi:AraC-like DNA-binding protein
MSRTALYTQLKSLTGISPKEFVSEFRLKKACMYLEKDSCTIAEFAYRTGFNDPVYFTRLFKQKKGMTPTQYRENKGMKS